MRPTGLGIRATLFYLLLVTAFFAAPYANLFFLLLVFLTLLGLFNAVSTYRNLEGVGGKVVEIEPTPASAGASFRARLFGGSRTCYAVRLELEIEGHEPVGVPVGLIRGETVVNGSLPALPRGLYRIVAARLVSSWPLGLVRRRVELETPGELIVYPAPAALATTRDGGGGVGDLYDALGLNDGFLQPSNLRDYRPGDELRLVHWKASARRTELVVKEWEGGTGSGHELLLDRAVEKDELDDALQVVSALALAAKEQKEPLTVHSQGMSATFGADHEPWRELFRFLAAAAPVSGPPPPSVSPSVLRLPFVRGGAA